MRTAFDDAIVLGWEPLEGTFGLPDPDDEHVAAAAVIGGAGVIVTENLKDFPKDKMPVGLAVQPAYEFAAYTVDVNPDQAVIALTEMCARMGNPPMEIEEVLEVLRNRYQMTEAIELIEARIYGLSDG